MLLDPVRHCPLCGAIVPNRKPIGKPFTCPGCASELELSRKQTRIEGWADVAVSLSVAWLFGFRWWEYAAAAVGLFVLLPFLWTPVWMKLWPTKLEPYKGGRIWG